jgi:hypothetical protein
MKNKIAINPQDYNLSLVQIENFAAEFFAKCLEPVRGDELEIEFDTIIAKNQFLEILDKTFKKKT